MQLFNGGGPVYICRHQVRRTSLGLQHPGKLTGGSCLAGALQAGQHNNHRLAAVQLQRNGLTTQQINQFLMNDLEYVEYEIQIIKQRMGPVHLKVILETGSLKDYSLIRKASLLAIGAGADFIKTSTGKVSPGATPEALIVMCAAVKDYYNRTGKKIGIKPAGGISDASTALVYYTIVKEILGEDWLNSERFRIGASRLANNLLAHIFDKGPDFGYF